MEVYLAVCTFLALATAFGNATILGVLSHKKQTVQSIYRLSLAVADFIMGVVVIPIYLWSAYNQLVQSPQFSELTNITGYDSALSMQPVVVELKGLLPNKYSSNYVAVSAFGFFNVLSLSTSVFSLVAATFDRFVAMHRPLKYNHSKAIFAAKITVVSLWFVGLTLAILPIVIPDVDYTLYISSFVSTGGNSFLMVYGIGIGFCAMVVLMWFLMIATYIAARSSLRRHDRQRRSNDERRLLTTLGIMITVFTLCIVPNTVVLIISGNSSHIIKRNSKDYDPVTTMKLFSAGVLVGLVLVSNSLWNCFIYSFREKSFRIATKLLYKRIVQRLNCFKLGT